MGIDPPVRGDQIDEASQSLGPAAIGPEYATSLANEPVRLYRGPIEFDLGVGTERREVEVRLDWKPRPHIAMHTQGRLPVPGAEWWKERVIRLPEIAIEADAQVIDFEGSPQHGSLTFAPLTYIGIGQADVIASVVFHVANLQHHPGDGVVHRRANGMSTGNRMTLEAEGWRVKLDDLEKQRDVIRSLKREGGHAITHVGRLSRSDGSTFGLEQFQEVGRLLQSFLAFIGGDRCSIVLPVAYGGDGREVWRGWIVGADAPWVGKPNWAHNFTAKWLAPAFSGFARRWFDPTWNEPIGLAVEWYIQAKRGTAETALLLGQSALELLGWVQFVEAGMMSGGAFNGLNAADRIRELLKAHSVKADLYDSLAAIKAVQPADQPFEDGPHAITSIRNAIVHPKKAKRQNALPMAWSARREAANLSLYYLECVLLKLIDFTDLNFIPATTLYMN